MRGGGKGRGAVPLCVGADYIYTSGMFSRGTCRATCTGFARLRWKWAKDLVGLEPNGFSEGWRSFAFRHGVIHSA